MLKTMRKCGTDPMPLHDPMPLQAICALCFHGSSEVILTDEPLLLSEEEAEKWHIRNPGNGFNLPPGPLALKAPLPALKIFVLRDATEAPRTSVAPAALFPEPGPDANKPTRYIARGHSRHPE